MEIIESIQNQKIKQIAKLHNRKDRKKMQQFIIEGEHLVEEAVNSNIDIEMILTVNPDRLTEAMVAGANNSMKSLSKLLRSYLRQKRLKEYTPYAI